MKTTMPRPHNQPQRFLHEAKRSDQNRKNGTEPVHAVSGPVMKADTSAPIANWNQNDKRLATEAGLEKAARCELSSKRFPFGEPPSFSRDFP